MHETLASESTETDFFKPWGNLSQGGRCFARLRGWLCGVAVDPSAGVLGGWNLRIARHVGSNPGPKALADILLDRAKEWIRGSAPAESPLGSLRSEQASAPRSSFRHTARDRLAGVALVLLVLIAVLVPPIQRSSVSDSQHLSEGLRRNFLVPTSDPSRLAVTALIMHEDAAVTVRSEDDEEDDNEPCSAMRQAYEAHDHSLSPSRGAPAWNRSVTDRLSASRPLRC